MPKLKLGVVDQSPVRTGGTAADAVRDTLELARETERLGYSRYWLAEHHSTNSFAGSSPAVLIARVAAETRRMRIGAGGVMLTHYSPLQVAESFRMLEALYPGRIDLGVGRAPGGDPRTAGALQYGRGAVPVEFFPQQVEDLIGWATDAFPDDHPFRRVRAMPRAATAPAFWLLGSGGSTAALAARLGTGYSYAQFISGQDGAAAVREYRSAFQPSAGLQAPEASVGIGVVCAETAGEAHRLAASLELWRARIMRGRDRGIPSPEEALEQLGSGWQPPVAGENGARVVAGDPDQVRTELLRIAGHYAVDEVMVVTVTHDYQARLRSYALLAEAMSLEPG
jgi:luciferase family oxidoreductase group 1